MQREDGLNQCPEHKHSRHRLTRQRKQAQAHAARLANQSQSVSEGKKDTFKELEKLVSLKQQGISNDEEFQRLKARLLSNLQRFKSTTIFIQKAVS